MTSRGVVLDAGAFIAIECRSRRMGDFVRRFGEEGTPLVTSAGVVAEVWRGGASRQVPVAFLLRRTDIVDLSDAQARIVGALLGVTGTRDPIDAHVALIARRRDWPVLTSDADDLRAIDRSLELYDI